MDTIRAKQIEIAGLPAFAADSELARRAGALFGRVGETASRGGDADTNGAIVGALLGARDGVDAIPRAWVDRVLAAKQRGSDAWVRRTTRGTSSRC
jgi:hypothetical protein